MKPTSIIFLVLSIILIIGGVITCFVASAAAKKEDIALFTQVENEDGDFVYTCEYEPEEIERISLSVKNAIVNVNAGDEDKIELINFTEGSYSRGISSKSYIIDDTFNISQLFVFDKGGFSFNGLRQYIRLASLRDKERVVNITLSLDALKVLSINVKNGSINIEGVSLSGDFILSATNGEINLLNVYTPSYIKLSGDKTQANIKGGYIKSLTCEFKSGELSAEALTVSNIKAETEIGNISLGIASFLDDYMINAQTDKGGIKIGTLDVLSPYIQGEDIATQIIRIKSGNGNISLFESFVEEVFDE